jgi:hypothetical protein
MLNLAGKMFLQLNTKKKDKKVSNNFKKEREKMLEKTW